MIVWLDQKIFGGRGLISPQFDESYYWLNGELYTLNRGLDAQLFSYQWRRARESERRVLCGKVFRPIHQQERFGRLRVGWRMIRLDHIADREAQFEELRSLLAELRKRF